MKLRSKVMAASRLLTAVATVAAVAASATSSEAINVTLTPASQTVSPGDSFEVYLGISGLGDYEAPSLGGYDLTVDFDAGVLSYNWTTFQNNLGVVFGSLEFDTPGVGTVELFGVSFDTAYDLDLLQPGAFSIATLSFTAVAEGQSVLDLSVFNLADAAGSEIVDYVLEGSMAFVTSGSVPEGELPGAGLILLGFTIASTHWLKRGGNKIA